MIWGGFQRIFLVECKSEDPEELLFYDKRVQRLVDKIGVSRKVRGKEGRTFRE